MQSDLTDALGAYAQAKFPVGTEWKTPDGYPSSLALCVLDSIWSIGVNYDRHVVPVLNRYRDLATSSGRDPCLRASMGSSLIE